MIGAVIAIWTMGWFLTNLGIQMYDDRDMPFERRSIGFFFVWPLILVGGAAMVGRLFLKALGPGTKEGFDRLIKGDR